MGSQMLIQGSKLPTPISYLIRTEKGVNFSPFLPKFLGSGTHCSKIDGFPGTHANGAIGLTNLLNDDNGDIRASYFNF